MALINCPECGKENVSNTATSCPYCGYNILAHMEEKQRLEKEREKYEKLQQQKQLKKELTEKRKKDPKYKKRIAEIACAIILVIILIVCAFVYKGRKAYDKDLSSVFEIELYMNIEDIIEFEASHYGNTEYNIEIIENGMSRVEFEPYEYHSETHYRHLYFFNTETEELIQIGYRDDIFDESGKCTHIDQIRNRALSISNKWDKSEYDALFLTMFGNIDGVNCKILYQNGSNKSINLIIDR